MHSRQALHSAERGEAAALLLSPRRLSSISASDLTVNGSQFTFFLTAPLLAFCKLVGLSSDMDGEVYNSAETIVSSALAETDNSKVYILSSSAFSLQTSRKGQSTATRLPSMPTRGCLSKLCINTVLYSPVG